MTHDEKVMLRLNLAKDQYKYFFEGFKDLPIPNEEKQKMAITESIRFATELMKANEEIPFT